MTDLPAEPAKRGRKPSEEKRAALIAAAYQLIAERGVDRTATRDIAALAQTTERTLFKHFGNKDGLVQAVIQTVSIELIRQAAFARIWEDRLFTAGEFTLWHKAFLRDRIVAAQAAPDTYRVLFQELLREVDFRARYVEKWRSSVFDPLARHLEKMQEAGAIGSRQSPKALAGTFFSLNISYLLTRFALAPDSNWVDERDIEAIAEMFRATCG